MRKIIISGLLFLFGTFQVSAQRIQQTLGRGVVAAQNGGNVTVTWRRLAQEPENVTYNLYVNGTKINSTPLTNTNYATTTGVVPVGSSIAVSAIVNGVESETGTPYVMKSRDLRNMFMQISFAASPLTAANYTTDYVWPADLDGDGEMDYVVNRKSVSTGLDNYIEGYLRTGEHLWTVKLGPNELSCAGQDDMILAYDMDCDGKADVVCQTSDGTQFWDAANKTFGLYVNGHTTGDTDGDGIINYETQATRNAPRYMTVVDGMTGKEKSSVEQTYNSAYNRTNRSSLMGDEYNKHVGHVGVFYHDGVHPAVIMEWHIRYSNGSHAYYNSAFAFDFSSGKAGEWKELFCKPTGGPAFHQIRIADVDADGKDEMLTGGYTMNEDGSTLNSPGIAHGDRFRTSDIDPERPGLETFAIQQNAGDMLGQILYDAATGEAIKKWYLGAVGDVGRGECMDIDPNHLGWEMWSTMGGVYNAKGNLIPEHTAPYPTEGIWWDGDYDREIVQTSDSHYNVYIQDYSTGRRLIEIAKLSGYRYVTVYAKRAAFWGDIIGDWREELVLLHKENGVCVGIVGFTTDITTNIDNIYSLQEDPAYRLQCTTKGYYQSPNTGFYLGYDMPRPQLPPCMVTDVIWKSTDNFTNYERSAAAVYEDGKSVLLDLNSDGEINMTKEMRPSVLYAMPVKGQTIALAGSGKLSGDMELWKSQAGTLRVDVPMEYTGTTYISEGTLEVNTELKSDVSLRARGTLSGNGSIYNISFEGALNYEGCRIAPNRSMTFKKGLDINKKVYMEMDLQTSGAEPIVDVVKVEGDLNVTAPVVFTIVTSDAAPLPGKYKLIEYSGAFNGKMNYFSINGLKGLFCELLNEDGAVYLIINEQRTASEGVQWMGYEDNYWNYSVSNFDIDGTATSFVANDAVEFTDDAVSTGVIVNELMPVAGISVDNSAKNYMFTGDGGFSGSGSLVKNGEGKLTLKVDKSDYTGATIINEGTVSVVALADGGMPSSFGAASSSAENLKIGKATLIVDNSNTSTNRGITLTDSATIQIPSGATSFKGIIKGTGTLIKSGTGQLNITYGGNNTWSGGTVITGGTLAMGTWNTTFGLPTSKITAKGGTIRIFDNNSTSAVPVFNNTLEIPEGKSVTMAGGKRCSIQGNLTGAGTLYISFPYVRGDVSTNMSAFSGTLNITSGQFRLVKATDLSKASVVLQGDAYLVHTKAGSETEVNLTTKIGSLTSESTTCSLGMGTYEIGYNNEDATYKGTFSTNAKVSKYGEGTWTLTNTSATSIDVLGGTLVLDANASLTGTVTVREGATLDLKGTAGAVTIRGGGSLVANPSKKTATTGYVTGNLNVQKGGVITVKKAGARYDNFEVSGRVSLNTPTINIVYARGTYEEVEEIKVFDEYTSLNVSGDVTVTPAAPAEGLAWDLSTFAEDGIIRIVKATGVNEVEIEQISVSPNPTKDIARVTFGAPLKNDVSLQLLSANGQLLTNERISAGAKSYDLEVSDRPSGIYFIRFIVGEEQRIYKLLKTE